MICYLCTNNTKLSFGHIIPEFFYKALYSDKHHIFSIKVGESQLHFIQKGIRDYLLCSDCERYIADNIETPFNKQWEKILPKYWTEQFLELNGLNYKITKLMILTNLWRAHCSKKKEWESVKLGPYATILANMIKNLDPGYESDFPIWGKLLTDKDGTVQHGLIAPFVQTKYYGHHIYYSIHGAIEWYITIGKKLHLNSADKWLTNSGSMKLVTTYIPDSNTFRLWKKQLNR